jgi:hypothetical protein
MCGDPNYECVSGIEAENLEESLLLSERQSLHGIMISPPEDSVKNQNAAHSINMLPNLVSAAEKNFLSPEEVDLQDDKKIQELEDLLQQQEEEEVEISQLAALTPTVVSMCNDPDFSFASTITPGN